MDDITDFLNLSFLEGVWESVNHNPTIIIYRHYSGKYHFGFVFINDLTNQATLSLYELEKDEKGFYLGVSVNYKRLSIDAKTPKITISGLGDYYKND